MIPFLERLRQPGVILADGAMGTMLFQLGLRAGECPERMNIERPEILEKIAGLYLEAGAEIIQTNTFGGSSLKLSMYGLEGKTGEINAKAVRAAKKIARGNAYIAASVGPTGKILEPYGDTKEEVIFESFQNQIEVLIEEGVDLICIETMSDINEAKLAVKAAKIILSEIPVCATMTFEPTQKGFFTLMGVSIKQAAICLKEVGADIIGSNCGNGIENMIAITKEFQNHTNLPISIKSNAGLPVMKNDISFYPETPEFMASKIKDLLNAGVKIIGGCCGTTPAHIAIMKKAIDNLSSQKE